MATKKKSNYWYVMVCTEVGPVFVTSVDNASKTAQWNKVTKPKELGEYWAKDLAFGLRCNFFSAFAVVSPIELDAQPYRYADGGHFEWKWDKDSEEGKVEAEK